MIKRNWKHRLTLLLLFLFLIFLFIFRILHEKVTPVLLVYATHESKKIATFLINDAISKKVVEELTTDNLFLLTKNDKGEIISIDFNSVIVNKILSVTTNTVEISLRYVEQGRFEELELSDTLLVQYEDSFKKGNFYEVPLGVAFNNSLFSNLGPKIPVKINLVGSIISGIETKVTNYGINNAMIEVYVHLQVNLQVIMPFLSDTIQIDTLVPIAMKLIQGNVPEYYAGNLSSPLLSVPIQ